MTPLPDGYRLRPAEPGDAAAVAALMAAVDLDEYGVAETTEDDVAEAWGRPRFDLARDAWVVFEPNASLAGYGDIWDPVPHVDFDLDPWVAVGQPREIERTLLDIAERRAREHLPLAPPDAEVVLHTVRSSVDTGSLALLDELGWKVVRTYLRMAVDLGETLPQPRTPPAIEVRPLRLGQDDAVAQATIEEAFAEHFRHPRTSLEEFRARYLGEHFAPDLCLLAWDGEQCAAALLGVEEADDAGRKGWIRELGVRRPWRGSGLGMAMLLHAFGRFAARGLRRVELGVDADNATNATGLYERAGMHAARAYVFSARTLRAAG